MTSVHLAYMDAVEDIKSRLSIEDVIDDYLELKRSGSNFKALSPFSNEKTPSFMISPQKQIWHDFSSGKGGDMFSFIMDMEGVDFKGALELLARKAGVDLSQYQQSGAGDSAKRKERLYQALDEAATYYQRQLMKHDQALRYVREKRGFEKQTLLNFRIGYSPGTGSSLYSFLKDKSFSDKELTQAGLITIRYNRPTDMFRDRIMVPLMDPHGRVIGFTARLLTDNPEAPKYINTPQTLLYDKSRHVYAFHLAKEGIRANKYCVLVEGNLDVVSAHQAGSTQVVATAGTALTEPHLKSVLHFTDDVRICFDQDEAGQKAIERSIGVASKVGVSLSVLPLPEGNDPDDLIRSDAKKWEEILHTPIYAIDWLIDRYQKQLDISTAQGKRAFTDVVLQRITELHDSVEQDHYIGVVARRLSVSKSALREKLTSLASPKARKRRQTKYTPQQQTELDKRRRERIKNQDHLLALALCQPAIRKSIVTLPDEVVEGDDAQKLFSILRSADNQTDLLASDSLREVDEYGKILQLQYEQLYGELGLIELRDEAKRLKNRVVEQYVTHKKHQIMTKLQDASEQDERLLLEQVNRLNGLLKH